jgi:glutathionylspermidine synthase
MKRRTIEPRPDWQKKVESQGMYYHSLPSHQPVDDPASNPITAGSTPYWDESAYYEFSAREIDDLEKCTYALNECCLKLVDHIIRKNLFEQVGVPPSHIDWVKRSWERDEHTILGRFDLAYDGKSPPKLLEYNADTPTGLLEAAVIQWFWLKDCQPRLDQFNTLHERLLEVFRLLAAAHPGRYYFTAVAGHLEDFMTVSYLRDCAMQTGLDTAYVNVEDIGWHPRRQFTDLKEQPIRNCVKLYPWEWMVRERFAQQLLLDTCNWLEPPWKMLLSNKAMLVLLYELFPESPYILRASFDPLDEGTGYVEKPIHGREGNNVHLVRGGWTELETDGPYDGPTIFQELKLLPEHDGNFPVIGSWMVNGYACGIGIREDKSLITQNTSRFVPHVFSR